QPIDHYSGFHLFFSQLASGDSVAPFRQVGDYEAGLARLKAYVHFLGRCEQRMVEGMGRGVVLPRLLAERLQVQMAELGEQAPGDSPFLKPTRNYPDSVPAADRGRLTALYTQVVEGKVRPAHRRLARFLAERYVPAARPGVGLSELPGGRALYEHLVRSQTTLDLAPEAIHALGLREVDKLTQGMVAIASQLGHGGNLAEFFVHLRSDARYRPASAAAMQAGYAAIAARVEARLGELFLHRPKTRLEIKPVPELEAPTSPGAYYMGGSLEADRAGVFYFNTHDLASRSTYGMETLYLHEAVPGHHYQGSLAAENEALPKLLRYEGGPAYWEGWALYAESLGPELGLFTDPLQHFGHLNDAMLRAMRLVVDTGLHVKGWSHGQAVDYMLAHSAMSRTEVVAEVERYIADPGQALSYKLGELHIRGLRQQAEARLGSRFDLRTFHDQVLNTGALPLTVLRAKIEGWIAQQAQAA
ncbi:MAG: hypothetical protein RL722_1940, partial [Pseudomonadota bacterium]